MTEPSTDPGSTPLANAYLFMGLGSLAILSMLMMSAAGRWAMVPTLIGAAALAFHWRSGALFVLASVAISQLWPIWYSGARVVRPASLIVQFAFCAAGVTYIISHYRLIGLTSGVFTRPRRKTVMPPPPRPAADGLGELGPVFFTVSVVTVGAFFLWELSNKIPPLWLISPINWRIGLLMWLLIGGMCVTAMVVSHLGWRRLTRTEARLFLQDALWHETRREQRRINRWRAWALRRRSN